ncbi:DivIVA domain-containing protein [candidate division WOR-3 bacterium]|nr:DivIVA domain-containing protein [candidate division WOR-3 bacterium]
MPLTPLDIRQKTFAGQLRGVNAREVTAFLELVAKEMEQLRKERGLLAEKVDEIQARVEQYQRTEDLLRDTMLTAQRTADECRANAEQEAAVIRRQAEQDAEEIRRRAGADAEALRRELDRLESERQSLLQQVRAIALSFTAMADRWQSGAGQTEDEPARED